MELAQDFVFRPLPALAEPVYRRYADQPHPLGPLANLPGTWKGKGFNQIWRPFRDPKKVPASGPNPPPNQDRFLELNLTDETIKFEIISGRIPNRGLLQQDLNMFGITYLQQIKDANVGAGLHIEPGIWLTIPPTEDPAEAATVCRMASIPHGTTIEAQGSAISIPGQRPIFAIADITPFVIGQPDAPPNQIPFPETDLAKPTAFRSPQSQIVGITQEMVNNPNLVLADALTGQTVEHMEVLQISTIPVSPATGGGTANTAYLSGAGDGPNAQAVRMDATFWIERIKHKGEEFFQLQYTQTVLLNFNGLSWPHVTVGTLRRQEPIDVVVDPKKVDPD